MLGFARASVSRFVRVQPARQLAFIASANTTSSEDTSLEVIEKKKSSIRKGLSNVANQKQITSPANEYQLLEKYKEDIENQELTSLLDLIEIVEWKNQIPAKFLEKAVTLWNKDQEMLSSLTDRQLSVLLSAYGAACNSMKAEKRSKFLKAVLRVVEKKNVLLGTKARGALLTSRIENGEKVNVVEELLAWDAAGVALDSFAYSKLAKIYANEGNLQGVVDIVNHMKSGNLPVDASLLEAMVYAIAKTGQYAQAEIAIKKFSSQPGQSEMRLRVSAASAAASRSDLNVVLKQLSMIPSSFDIHVIENNMLILSILYQLLENGQFNAIDQMRSFLTMTEDGATLSERHRNAGVVFDAIRMQNDGKLEAALRTYSLVHPSARKYFAEERLCSSISDRICSEDATIDEIIAITNLAENVGVIEKKAHFLLSRCAGDCPVKRAREIYNIVKERGDLVEAIMGNLRLRKSLSKKLTEDLPNLTQEAQIGAVVDAAYILLKSLKGHRFTDICDIYSHIFNIVGEDVSLPIAAIPLIDDLKVRKEFSTAIVFELLRSRENLQEEKLKKFLDSDVVESVSLHCLTQEIVRFLIENRTAKNNKNHLELATKILVLGFSDHVFKEYSIRNLIDICKNEMITEEDVGKLVSLLEKEHLIRFSTKDLAIAEKLMGKEKYTHVERLQRKNNDLSILITLSIEALEEKLAFAIKKNKTYLENILRDAILTKIIKETPIDITLAERHVREARNSNPHRIVNRKANVAQSLIFEQVVADRQLDQAASFWALRGETVNLVPAITFASLLYLNGQKEQAEVVFQDVKNTGLVIKKHILESVGLCLADFPESEIESVAAVLRQNFNLREEDTRPILSSNKMKTVIELMEQGKFDAAFQFAADESNACSRAFGQYEMARAAIRNGDAKLLKDTFNLIVKHHSRSAAFIDIAYVMLEEGQDKYAQKLLNANGLVIPTKKLAHFVREAVNNQRPDVLHGLFTGLNVEGRATTVDMNNLLQNLVRLYYKLNDVESLSSLEEECRRTSFPLETKIRAMFDAMKKQSSIEPAV